MIVVISNRNINSEFSDERLFGEQLNPLGAYKSRVALADFNDSSNRWNLELISEDNGSDEIDLSSKKFFDKIAQGIKDGSYKKNWVFYVPGFNQSSRGGLDASLQIAQKYDVDIILFSWPSNPGGSAEEEYKEVRKDAIISSQALDRAIEKLDKYVENWELENEELGITINLLAHSLGNFVLENYIRHSDFTNIKRIFNNVILHEPDVDNKSHTQWIDNITFTDRIFVTINIHDDILELSGVFHKKRLKTLTSSNRLGNSHKNLSAKKPIYIDFTHARFVSRSHNLFLKVDNPIVVYFFQQVFQGKKPILDSQPFDFDATANMYILDRRNTA